MQRILLAMDGSDHAERALDLASSPASKYDAELVLLHVLSDKRLSEAERQMAEVEYLGPPRACSWAACRTRSLNSPNAPVSR